MADHLLQSLGLLDSRNRASLTREDVEADMVRMVRAVAAGVVAPMTVSEWALLSDLTRTALDDVLAGRVVEVDEDDGDSAAIFAGLQAGLTEARQEVRRA